MENNVLPTLRDEEQAREYIFDRVFRHIDTTNGLLYVISWYRYDKNDDATATADKNLRYFRDAYWRQLQKRLLARRLNRKNSN